MKKLLDLDNARVKNQKEKMKKLIKEGVCPFCPKYLEKYHDNPIEKKGRWWSITKNDYPYEGTAFHYIFIYNKHVEDINKINPEAAQELFSLLKWLEKKLKLKGGAIVVRFGESSHTGASVAHLHGHLIVGGLKKKKSNPLKVFVGYQK